MADRGWRDPAYVLLTPANQYARRLAGMPGVTVADGSVWVTVSEDNKLVRVEP